MKKNTTIQITLTGLLIALGIVIPMFSPLKIVIEPASFTLASHVPVLIAMFISPFSALAVALGTAAGFFWGGFPIIIVLRALTHVIFALAGSLYLMKNKNILSKPIRLRAFSLIIALIHGLCEVAIVTAFYFSKSNQLSKYYEHGFFQSVILLVGIGTVIHSMIDCELTYAVMAILRKQKSFEI